jgi:hypothetical protein
MKKKKPLTAFFLLITVFVFAKTNFKFKPLSTLALEAGDDSDHEDNNANNVDNGYGAFHLYLS